MERSLGAGVSGGEEGSLSKTVVLFVSVYLGRENYGLLLGYVVLSFVEGQFRLGNKRDTCAGLFSPLAAARYRCPQSHWTPKGDRTRFGRKGKVHSRCAIG